MKTIFDQYAIDLTPNGKNYKAALDDKTVDVEIVDSVNGRLDLIIDGKRVTAYVSSDGSKRWVTVHGRTFVLTKSSSAKQRSGAGHDHASELAAPMPGQVRSVNVKEGDAVTKGQTLLVLEAMKMEIRIQSPRDGKVKTLHVKQGQTVEREQVLIELEEK
ncbi:MAG TPA: biotin/lipoyl-containing protein [Anaerolineales bacterium]